MKKLLVSTALVCFGSILFLTHCSDDEKPEPKPAIGFLTATSSAVEGQGVTVAFSATLPTGVTPMITYGGTATQGTDYTFTVSSTGIVFTILADAVADPNETIILTLTGFNGNATLGAITVHTITIAEPIDFSTTTSTVTEGQNVSVLFSAALGTGVTPTITYSGTATQGTDYTFTVSSTGITFTILEDEIYDPNETIILTLTGFSGGAAVGAKTVHTITITDKDEDAVPGLRINLSWNAGDGTAGDVDMDMFLWMEDPANSGNYRIIDRAENHGTGFETLFLPSNDNVNYPDRIYGMGYNYYSGTSNNLQVKVDFKSFKGNLNGEGNKATYTALYTLANVNNYDVTGDYFIVQVFTKVGANFNNFTDIEVLDAGSRQRLLQIISQDSKSKKSQLK